MQFDPTPPSKSQAARKGSRNRIGLSSYQENCRKRQLRKLAPSEPWVEAQFRTVRDQDENGQPIVYRYHDSRVFPPGGAETRMVRCPVCGVFTPPNSMEHGLCLDHADHSGWGPSPSALAIAGLQKYHLKLDDMVLKAEDTASLRKEIEAYEALNASAE